MQIALTGFSTVTQISHINAFFVKEPACDVLLQFRTDQDLRVFSDMACRCTNACTCRRVKVSQDRLLLTAGLFSRLPNPIPF